MSVAAALLLFACGNPALAQNATWTGAANNDFTDGGNWTSDPLVPAGTATFSGAGPVNIDVPSGSSLETIRFIGSTSYRIDVLCGCGLTLTGSGVLNDTNLLQTFRLIGGSMTFSNAATVTGQVEINNNGGILLFGSTMPGGTDTASAGTATIINRNLGVTVFAGNTDAGTADITNRQGGATFFLEQSSAATSSILIRDFSQVFFGTPGSTTDAPTAAFANIQVNGGDLIFSAFSTAANSSIRVRNGGQLLFFDFANGGNASISTDSNLFTLVDFSGSAGPLGNGVISVGSIEGGGTFFVGSNNLVVGSNNLSTTISGALIDGGCGCGGPGTLTKIGSGTLTFAASIDLTQFFGSLVVNGGTVVMNGDMSSALQAIANSGGILAGAGILPPTFIDGGTLSPGNGMTGNIAPLIITDQVTFAGNGTYRVDVAPSNVIGQVLGAADITFINSFGAPSTVAGTVNAIGMGGRGYTIGTIYPILVAPDGLNGTRFDRLFVSGSFGSTRPILTYDDPLNPGGVNIQLIQGEISSQLTSGATQNQIALAGGIDNALRNGADFGVFTPLYNLTGDNFLKALDQLSGEANTGVFQAVYQSVGNFINSMLNPFNSGRGTFGPATSFAAEDEEADAYAAKRKISRQAQQAMAAALPLKAAPVRDSRYSIWANGYGGQTSMDANNTVGSHQTDVRGYGFAAGLDFRISPDALVGFALGGGNSSWGLAEGLGGGKSDNFHAGAYGSLRFGPAYLSAAMAYGAHWVSTKRSVFLPGFAMLESDYDAQSFGGRLEAGYRYGQGSLGMTPYAALQASVVRLPSYLEGATAGASSFALQYDRQSDSLFRTELGSWFDHSRVIPGGVMTLRARAAWAHDEGADRALTGAFPVLPGSSFLVQGASPGNNLALLSAGAEFRYWNGFSFAARFDSELSDRARGYGGTGTVRYVW